MDDSNPQNKDPNVYIDGEKANTEQVIDHTTEKAKAKRKKGKKKGKKTPKVKTEL